MQQHYDWVFDVIDKNQINNLFTLDCAKLFHGERIFIEQYDLIMITTETCAPSSNSNEKCKNYEMFRILEGGGSTFFGLHKILWEGCEYYIPNLSILKKRFFLFNDKLTFERCTFLILPEQRKLIRLKNVRNLVCYGKLAPFNEEIKVHLTPEDSRMQSFQIKIQKPMNLDMFERQKRKSQDMLLTAYKRFCPDLRLTEVCDLVQSDYAEIFTELKKVLRNDEESEEMNEDIKGMINDEAFMKSLI
jgi:hypothetical protein